MRNVLMLAVSAMLAACGVGNATTTGVNPATDQGASAPKGAVNGADYSVGNAAADNVGTAGGDQYSDGHLPANWYHGAGDILILEGEGLSFAQPGLHPARFIDFGLTRDVVVRAVTMIRGRPSGSGRTMRCGGGPMDFTAFGAIVLNFRHGRFVGWVLNPGVRPLIETDLGLGIGTPRDQVGYGDQDLERVVDSPQGPRFEVNGIGGFLRSHRPDARVTRLYAGATCFAPTPSLARAG